MLPVGEARSAHHDVLHQAQVGHLMLAASVVEQHRGLHLVGLDAPHVVRLLKDHRDLCNPLRKEDEKSSLNKTTTSALSFVSQLGN